MELEELFHWEKNQLTEENIHFCKEYATMLFSATLASRTGSAVLFLCKTFYRHKMPGAVMAGGFIDESRMACQFYGMLGDGHWTPEKCHKSHRTQWCDQFAPWLTPLVNPKLRHIRGANVPLLESLKADEQAMVVWVHPMVASFFRSGDLFALKDWLTDNSPGNADWGEDMPLDPIKAARYFTVAF